MDLRDSLQMIEMDKGGEGFGPLFEEPKRRLQDDPAFRAAWGQYQALKALAWEAAPELDERLVRQALQAGRRQEVERRLARATGSQDAARELLLSPEKSKSGGLPTWAAFFLLVGALGLGWLAFKPADSAVNYNPPPLPTPVPDAALAFEFPVSGTTGADAGLPPVADETQSEDPAARQARQLMIENLRAAQAPKPSPAPTARPKPRVEATRSAPSKPLPRSTPKASPTPAPTAVPALAQEPTSVSPAEAAEPELSGDVAPATLVPTTLPSAVATMPPARRSPFQAMDGEAGEASLSLSSAQFPAQATLSLPESGSVDLRLFDMRGRLVRRYAEGDVAAGRWRLDLPGTDEQGQALPKGNYYLRAITRWFSKVEAIDQP